MKKTFLFSLLVFLISSCVPSKVSVTDDVVEVTILQVNDVYEIAPLEGGKVGGMARVAQVKKDLLAENPNTIAMMAGDFLNPSVIGTLKYNGSRIKGAQMVETMNVAGIDMVTFGNHEFDIDEEDLLKRIKESEFKWVAANVFHVKDGKKTPYMHKGEPIQDFHIQTFKNPSGRDLKMAVIGICLDVNKPDHVVYDNALETIKAQYEIAKTQADIVIGLTHQSIAEDKAMAAELQGIPLVIGGHEHHNMIHKVGKVRITKADANAKTAYIHKIKYNTKTDKFSIESTLKAIDTSIKNEPKTQAVVDKWTKIANDLLVKQGINPEKVIKTLDQPIDATEKVVRYRPSVISTLVTNAVAAAAPNTDGALINTGSIRIDDILSGEITEFDVVRLLPFGGSIEEVEMKGDLLLKILEIGVVKNFGTGGYFALSNITYNPEDKSGMVNNKTIESSKSYKIAMPSFLMKGKESNLDFLLPTHPSIVNIIKPSEDIKDLRSDIKLAVVDYIKNNPIPVID